MPRGPYPALLMLAMSLPGAAKALGLGDIRVNSALNEPLSAQIDLVGATPEELATLTAQLADAAMFQRYGADRPSYLSTVGFKVEMNSQGRPVLEVRSTAPFAEPIVNFLVDIRWPEGELIRDYSLLLDPKVFAPVIASAPEVAAAPGIQPASPAPTAIATLDSASPVPPADHGGTVYQVLARDTLYDIVRRAGALTESEALQMMIAVFRANPAAFDRNINLLRRGALLAMPSAQEVAAVDPAQARRLVARQMWAWRRHGTGAEFHPVGSGLIAVPPSVQGQIEAARVDLLNSRVQSLEAALEAEQRQVASLKATIDESRQPVALPPDKAPAPEFQAAPSQPGAGVGARFSALLLSAMALVVGLPLLGLALLRRMRRQSVPIPQPALDPHFASVEEAMASSAAIEAQQSHADPGPPPPGNDAVAACAEAVTKTTEVDVQLLEQLEADYAAAAASRPASDVAEKDSTLLDDAMTEEAILTAVAEQIAEKHLSATMLDYNLVDLDSKAPHVHLPSELNDRQGFVERRTSVIDALRVAIKRDPLRRDLCMKLLETYQSTASANRRAFAEFVRTQARGPNSLTAEDWQKIAAMGRELGLDENLLANPGSEDLANCA